MKGYNYSPLLTPQHLSESIRLMEVMAPWGEGGGPVFLRNLAGRLDPKIFLLSFVFTEQGGLYEEMQRRGLPVFFVPHSRLIQPSVIWKLARIFKAHSPHIVQSHGARMNVYTRLAARLAGVTGEAIPCPVPIERIRLPLGRGWISRAAKSLILSAWAVRIFLREQPRLVCAGQATAGGIAAWVLHLLFGARYVLIVHGGDLLGRPAVRWLFRRMLARAAMVVTNSRFSKGLASSYMSSEPQNVRVLYPPLTSEFFALPERTEARRALGLQERKLLVLSVARLVRRKGIGRLLGIFPDLIKSFPDLTWLIVGEGPERRGLEEIAERSGLRSSHVQFEGFVARDRLPLYYAASDLFVLTPIASRLDAEGFGIVYLEAQAAGLPVIATASGGVSETLRDQETGILIPEDEPDALRKAIAELLKNSEKRVAMGHKAKLWVRENFDPSRQAAEFWRMLQESVR